MGFTVLTYKTINGLLKDIVQSVMRHIGLHLFIKPVKKTYCLVRDLSTIASDIVYQVSQLSIAAMHIGSIRYQYKTLFGSGNCHIYQFLGKQTVLTLYMSICCFGSIHHSRKIHRVLAPSLKGMYGATGFLIAAKMLPELFSLKLERSDDAGLVKPAFSQAVERALAPVRKQTLTQAALETLCVVAYRQPVTRAEIEAIRGVNADGAISRLSEKELIYISGRADLPGRPIQYATTQNFLDYAGINSLDELPASDVLSPGQIAEWIRRAGSGEEISDTHVGLPSNADEPAELEGVESAGASGSPAGSLNGEAGGAGEKFEMEFEEVSKEIEVEPGTETFPADGAESADSDGEFKRP